MPTDPILYPLPRGTAESLRQDIYRTRADLVETATVLRSRLDPHRELTRVARSLARTTAPLGGGLAAGTLAAVAGRVSGHHRGTRRVAVVLAGAGGYLLVRRVVRHRPVEVTGPGGPVLGEVEVPQPQAPPAPALRADSDVIDVVDVLIAQHTAIEALFERVATAPAKARTAALAALVELLTKHEHAEQEIVHAELRSLGGDATATVEGRLDEERLTDRALASLVHRGVDDGGFEAGLTHLRDMVRAHARHEETEEFPLLRANVTAARRQSLANQVNAAQVEP